MTTIAYKDTGATSLAAAVVAADKLATTAQPLVDLILPSGQLAIGDFSDFNAGVQCRRVNLRGPGADKLTLVAKGPYSTKLDPALATNPFYAIMAAAGYSTTIEGFTLDCSQASAADHLFGGIRLGAGGGKRTTTPIVNGVRVIGARGTNNTPPGEIFGLNVWNCDGAVLDDVEIDGDDVGAAGIGFNSSNTSYLHNVKSHGNAHSHGITFWQSNGALMSDIDLYDNGIGLIGPSSSAGVGLNLERSQRVQGRRVRLVGNSGAGVRVYTDNVSAWPSSGNQLLEALIHSNPFTVMYDHLAKSGDLTIDSASLLVGSTTTR